MNVGSLVVRNGDTMAYRATELTQSKKADTRARILSQSIKLLTQQGFGALSVVVVAQNSGIATGSIYRHFPSKADLVAEVFRHATEQELAAVRKALQSSGTCKERLLLAMQTFAIRALKAPRQAYALIAEPVDPIVEQERLRYRLAYAEAFEDLISEGVSQGEFLPQKASITAAAIVGMLTEALIGPLSPHGSVYDEKVTISDVLTDVEQQQLILQITTLALRAVGTQ